MLTLVLACLSALPARALDREALADLIVPPYALGQPVNDKGVYALLNSGGAEAGFVFETQPLAPLPGFSGQPINMLVMLDNDGRFLDVRLIAHNEPIFVSGLGEAPFREFLEQYRGHSISEDLVVGVPYGAGGAGSDLSYLDGVTKATASVRIAHESIMAAALAVARQKMQGVSSAPPARPDPAVSEALTWADLVDQGIARHLRVTNAEADAAFAGTVWADDDAEAQADPQGLYLDLWLVDIGPPSVARAVLDKAGFEELQRFLRLTPDAEPLLLIENGRHGLVSVDFVRNTAPDRLSAAQDGLPVALRDADLFFDLAPDVPAQGVAMILRADRRLGFDPVRDWDLTVQAVREHGMFQPETGSQHFTLTYAAPERFFIRPQAQVPPSPLMGALQARRGDLIALALFLTVVVALAGPLQRRFAAWRHFTPARLGLLAVMTGFVGFWGQGQLSIVTVLASLRAAIGGGSFEVLLYDPFSLLIWVTVLVGFVLWGRGLFCGWLCPFGAMQEFTAHLGRGLKLPRIEPSAAWDRRLKGAKYLFLAGLIGIAFLAPDRAEKAAEIEPFKTAITTGFQREWFYVAYALFWLVGGMVLFKGFCRYVCPLGAVMAIGGLLRRRDWIARRAQCGSPCQLCRVRCRYGAIHKTGKIDYSECFQCLDCVKIHDDPAQCVPVVLARKQQRKAA